MKHSLKITFILLGMFFITQIVGILVVSSYIPQVKQVVDSSGNVTNVTVYDLPYGMNPPDTAPKTNLVSIMISIAIAVVIMFVLMKVKAEMFLRLWFFIVVALAIGITINSAVKVPYWSVVSFLIALPLAFWKIFKRNIIVHNVTEVFIYPGIASIFVPLLNVGTMIVLLIVISLYDMYAVWHAGFMQKMAKYQIQKLKLFSGFFIPYMSPKEKAELAKSKGKKKKVKVSLAILGGGDVVFPIILAGVVLRTFGGFIPALIIAIGATLALAGLFYLSEKGKFYPAMPFITAGCFLALGLVYLIF
ncbi:hypothetical protein KW787_03445 [Candidatus Pacearchaeota archaeon]|nr:hypothetical protein [Candidatus Pacearchaeota archaeon]